MRILFWQETFWPQIGGVEAQAEWLLPALRARGHDIVVVTRQDAPDLPRVTRWEGVSLHRFPFWQALDSSRPSAVLALQREIEQLERAFAPEVVHLSGFGPTALFLLHARRAHRAPLLVTIHSSNNLTSGRTTLTERTLASADWVSACSQAMLDDARRCVPAIAARSSVVYNGVPVPPLAPAPLPVDEPRVLCLGHLVEHKGFDLVVDAVAALIARFPTLRLILAGDGPALATLEQRAAEAGIGPAVEFPGLVPRTEVARLINSATIVAVPSRRESFGLVAVEAALMQRPVVAARVGGLPEVVAHEETGLLVEPENSAALAHAIASLLSNPQTAERMGVAARSRAQSKFALGAQCDAYEDLYRRIGAGQRVSAASAAAGREVSDRCE